MISCCVVLCDVVFCQSLHFVYHTIFLVPKYDHIILHYAGLLATTFCIFSFGIYMTSEVVRFSVHL